MGDETAAVYQRQILGSEKITHLHYLFKNAMVVDDDTRQQLLAEDRPYDSTRPESRKLIRKYTERDQKIIQETQQLVSRITFAEARIKQFRDDIKRNKLSVNHRSRDLTNSTALSQSHRESLDLLKKDMAVFLKSTSTSRSDPSIVTALSNLKPEDLATLNTLVGLRSDATPSEYSVDKLIGCLLNPITFQSQNAMITVPPTASDPDSALRGAIDRAAKLTEKDGRNQRDIKYRDDEIIKLTRELELEKQKVPVPPPMSATEESELRKLRQELDNMATIVQERDEAMQKVSTLEQSLAEATSKEKPVESGLRSRIKKLEADVSKAISRKDFTTSQKEVKRLNKELATSKVNFSEQQITLNGIRAETSASVTSLLEDCVQEQYYGNLEVQLSTLRRLGVLKKLKLPTTLFKEVSDNLSIKLKPFVFAANIGALLGANAISFVSGQVTLPWLAWVVHKQILGGDVGWVKQSVLAIQYLVVDKVADLDRNYVEEILPFVFRFLMKVISECTDTLVLIHSMTLLTSIFFIAPNNAVMGWIQLVEGLSLETPTFHKLLRNTGPLQVAAAIRLLAVVQYQSGNMRVPSPIIEEDDEKKDDEEEDDEEEDDEEEDDEEKDDEEKDDEEEDDEEKDDEVMEDPAEPMPGMYIPDLKVCGLSLINLMTDHKAELLDGAIALPDLTYMIFAPKTLDKVCRLLRIESEMSGDIAAIVYREVDFNNSTLNGRELVFLDSGHQTVVHQFPPYQYHFRVAGDKTEILFTVANTPTQYGPLQTNLEALKYFEEIYHGEEIARQSGASVSGTGFSAAFLAELNIRL